MNIKKEIGANLRAARKSLALTQKDVAKMLNMTQQQYSRFENGIFELNYQQILDLCNILEITPNELFDI